VPKNIQRIAAYCASLVVYSGLEKWHADGVRVQLKSFTRIPGLLGCLRPGSDNKTHGRLFNVAIIQVMHIHSSSLFSVVGIYTWMMPSLLSSTSTVCHFSYRIPRSWLFFCLILLLLLAGFFPTE